MSQETLLVTLEALLIGGGALAFGLWQLHDVRKARERAQAQREEEARSVGSADARQSDKG